MYGIRNTPMILWTCLLFSFTEPTGAQKQIYSHPDHMISFTASSGWADQPARHAGEGYTLIHPNRNMEISLHYYPGCPEPAACMDQLAGSMGLSCPSAGSESLLNEKRALVMKGFFARERRPYRCLLAGIPVEEGLCIVRIICPEDCFEAHRGNIGGILSGLKVGRI